MVSSRVGPCLDRPSSNLMSRYRTRPCQRNGISPLVSDLDRSVCGVGTPGPRPREEYDDMPQCSKPWLNWGDEWFVLPFRARSSPRLGTPVP
jgi:hypothetical protein